MEAVQIYPVNAPVMVDVRADRISWAMTAFYPILPEDARKGQLRQGYDPMAYGFFEFFCSEEPQGQFVATWASNARAAQ